MHWLHTHGTRWVKSCKTESEAGETASTACQIDRDALIEVLRGPYATYEERADAVCDLLGGQGEG
jgi:hypothetical protein